MKKALILYGTYEGHTPRESSEGFEAILTALGFTVTKTDDFACLEDSEALQQYDLFVPNVTMGTITKQQCRNICNAVSQGLGIAGWHGGMCDSFRANTDWQFMTGSQFVAHPGGDQTTYSVHFCPRSEFAEGMADFSVTSEQYYLHYDPAVTVHATTDFIIDGQVIHMPVIYTKNWGKGRVFYCSLGHTYEMLALPQLKEIMARGFLWSTRRAFDENI